MENITTLGGKNQETGFYVFPCQANKIDKYSCPDCYRDLVLCRGPKVKPYFRHRSEKINKENECVRYNNPTETEIHKDAKLLIKQLIDKKKSIIINKCCERCNKTTKYNIEELSDNSEVKLEYSFMYCDNIKIADVVYLQDNKIKYIFEICNTHKTLNEDRPEPWFELDANTVINTLNEQEKDNYEFTCIRCDECESCLEKRIEEICVNDINTLVRYRLGQFIKNNNESNIYHKLRRLFDDEYLNFRFPNEKYGENYNHLKIDFDAQCDKGQSHNKNIMSLFEDFYDKYRLVLTSHEGNIIYYIVIKEFYDLETKIDLSELYVPHQNNQIYSLHFEELSGYGTIQILTKALQKIIETNKRTSIPFEDKLKLYLKTDLTKYVYLKLYEKYGSQYEANVKELRKECNTPKYKKYNYIYTDEVDLGMKHFNRLSEENKNLFVLEDDDTILKNIISTFDDICTDFKITIHYRPSDSHCGYYIYHVISKDNYEKIDCWKGFDGRDALFPYETSDISCELESNDNSFYCYDGITLITSALKDVIKLINRNKRYSNKRCSNEIINFSPPSYLYMKVPFNKKDNFKQYGGKWDPEKKSWYISKNQYDKNKDFIDEITTIITEEVKSINTTYKSNNNSCEHCGGFGIVKGMNCIFC